MYGGPNEDPRYANSSKYCNLIALEQIDAIMNELRCFC